MTLLGACLLSAAAALTTLAPVSAQSTLPRAESRSGLIPGSAPTEFSRSPVGAGPEAAPGMHVAAFADALDHPRWLHVLPDGDVLVTETRAPPKRDDLPGLKGWRHGLLLTPTGADGPRANRVVLQRDTDGDGVADLRSVLLQGLNSPLGMSLVGDALFVATTYAVLRFPYSAGDTRITAVPSMVLQLPGILLASLDGTRLYVNVGSDSNIGERGLAAGAGRAAIRELDIRNGTHRVYAAGLRDPNGLAWEPGTGSRWAVVVEREGSGGDPVPDYLTSLHQSGFYGWPYSDEGESGRPVGPPVDLLTGFLADDGTARGRPVGVVLDAHGALLVADDIADVVWRVTSGR